MTQTAQAPVLGEAALQELREGLRGEVILPGDAGYDQARSVWNGMIDRRPALIARCAGAADVIAALCFARSQDLLIAVRGGGHNFPGFGTCDNGIVIDLSPMKGIRVDPAGRTARAQAGVLWGELDHEAQAFGLATTGGLVSITGIAGFTLGGGIGWLMRKHGATVDNLLSVDLVTADGELLTAGAERNPELFWGLRGGGGNFGVATSFEYRLHPVGPVVAGGAAFWPVERAGEVLRFFRDWTPTLPDELTSMVALLTAPPEPFIPEPLRGTTVIAVAACHAGTVEQGLASLQPLKDLGPAVDLLGPIPYTALQGMFDASAPHGIHGYFKNAYAEELSDQAIAIVLEHAAELAGLSPFTQLHLHHLGGAIDRVDPDATAFGGRGHRYVYNIIGLWNPPEDPDAHIAWTRDLWSALRPVTADAPYLNFLADEGQDRVRAAYGEDHYRRLATLKRRYDPTNVFRLNQNIQPAAG